MTNFDLVSAASSLEALQGLVGGSAEGRQNITALSEMVADADYTIKQLTRALREETEPPTFMGEPVTLRPINAEQAFGAVYDMLLTHPIKSAFRAADDGPEGEPPPVDEEMLVAVQADRFALMFAVRELRRRKAFIPTQDESRNSEGVGIGERSA